VDAFDWVVEESSLLWEGELPKAILSSPKDNVATCIEYVDRGEVVTFRTADEPLPLVAGENIPFGHKIAVDDIPAGAMIVKYGETIGNAKALIARGQHAHVHNIRSLRAQSQE
jgi:altronate dehydratase small subunit